MKKLVVFLLLIGAVASFGCFASDDSDTVAIATGMTLKSNVSMSTDAGNPPVNDSVQTIALEFSSPLKASSIATSEIKLFKMKAAGAPETVPVALIYDEMAPTKLNIAKTDGSKLTEGEEYKLTISASVKSTGELALTSAFEGYFATNYTFALSAAGIPDMGNERSMVIAVSDIHLGADTRYSQFDANGAGNGAAFIEFLNKISVSPNVKELVIAGDLLDEWIIPGAVDTFDTAHGGTQATFIDRIAVTHAAVITAIKNVMASGVTVTYVIGNHDMLVDPSDLTRILPGINQAAMDVRGVAKYSPAGRSELGIEHGHRYNIFAAPDTFSKPGSILPAGYFFARVGTTSVTEGLPAKTYEIPTVTKNGLSASQDNLFYYWQSWKGILTGLYVNESFTDKFIVTNIDGYTEKYGLADFFPSQAAPGGIIDVNLYKGIQDNWPARCVQNNVPMDIPTSTAIINAALASDLDNQAKVQYFSNTKTAAGDYYFGKRVAIFGHSHEARIITSNNLGAKKCVYANTGTWIDSNPAGTTMNFVVVTPPKTAAGSAPEFVHLYQYFRGGNMRKMDAQAITLQ